MYLEERCLPASGQPKAGSPGRALRVKGFLKKGFRNWKRGVFPAKRGSCVVGEGGEVKDLYLGNRLVFCFNFLVGCSAVNLFCWRL